MRQLKQYTLYGLPAVLLLVNVGCSRSFFRQAADRDVEGLMTEKNQFPEWDVKSWSVNPDPRSRYADNNNPDRPPMPPDDYAARVLSPNPQHPTYKTGVGRVDGDGYLKMLEEWNSQNRAADPTNARGVPPDPPIDWMIVPKQQPPAPLPPSVMNPPQTAPSPAADVGPWVRAQPAVAAPEKPPATPSEPATPSAQATPSVTESRDGVPAIVVVPVMPVVPAAAVTTTRTSPENAPSPYDIPIPPVDDLPIIPVILLQPEPVAAQPPPPLPKPSATEPPAVKGGAFPGAQ